MEIQNISLQAEKVRKAKKNIRLNDGIADYYEALSVDYYDDKFHNRASAVKYCFKYWDVDYFTQQGIKDVLKVNRCRDLFCRNCQKQLAEERFGKYVSVLKDLRKSFDLYHIVFTVPNCKAPELNDTLTQMYKKFIYINQYLQCKRKIKGLDLKQLGYNGAVRSLEITTKSTTNGIEYHPHFHTLFLFRKGIRFRGENKNQFSYDNEHNRKTRTFNDFEILLQKMWYLFYNEKKVSLKSLAETGQGYSVVADKFKGENDFKEVFKYSIKGPTAKGVRGLSYETFKTLYRGLHRRKIIQGYGRLNKFTFDDGITKEEIERIYSMMRDDLITQEEPVRCISSLEDVLDDLENRPDIIYISKNKIRGEIKNER